MKRTNIARAKWLRTRIGTHTASTSSLNYVCAGGPLFRVHSPKWFFLTRGPK